MSRHPADQVRHLANRALNGAPEPVRQRLLAGSYRLSRAIEGPPPAPEPTPDPRTVWTSPQVPTPAGVTLAGLEAVFRSWAIKDERIGHMDEYLQDSLHRFLHTWNLVRDERGSCLELGANPYFITYLLEQHTELDVTLANYYGESGRASEQLSYLAAGATERSHIKRDFLLFNVEDEDFPYPDDAFDVLLFCEMLEHLVMNPVAALREIHRVLKPGGMLVLTTPNVARLGNVMALTNGVNIYDPYSGFGPYGRHNREYTLHELHRLLEFLGFEIDRSLTADGNVTDDYRWPLFDQVSPLLRLGIRSYDLGEYLFVRARAVRPPRPGLPSFLFRSWEGGAIVEYR